MRASLVLGHLQAGAAHARLIQIIGGNMKRLLVVMILAVGLLAVAGATSVDRLRMTIADGEPPPPPKPPLPQPWSGQVDYQKSAWLTADGEPPPPPGPWLVQSA